MEKIHSGVLTDKKGTSRIGDAPFSGLYRINGFILLPGALGFVRNGHFQLSLLQHGPDVSFSCHHSESRIAQVRPGVAKLLHSHVSVQTAGAVDLQTVREEVELYRPDGCSPGGSEH